MEEWFILALYAAAFATFSTILDKKILYKEHALEYVTTWAIATFFLSAPFFIFKINFNFEIYIWGILILVSIINTAGLIYLAKAFRHLKISVASPLMGFEPVFVVLLSFLFLKEQISSTQGWGLMLIMAGGYLLELKKDKFSLIQPIKDAINSKYIHYGLLSIVFYSFSSVISRFIINTENSSGLNIYTYHVIVRFFVAFFLLILLSVFYDGIQGVKNGIKKMGWLLLPASFLSVAHGLLTLKAFSIPSANAGLVLAVKRISIFFETLIGGELFHDKDLMIKVISSITMIIGAYLMLR